MNQRHDNHPDTAPDPRATGDHDTDAEPLVGQSDDATEPAANETSEREGDGLDQDGESDAPENLMETERELEAARDRYLRLAAEFDNYRKRTDRERTEVSTRAQGQLIERLLDGLDDLQRVARIDPDQTTAGALLEGVQLVERKVFRVLESSGLETVDAQDQQFDPAVHEALVTSPVSERERDDTIAEVFQPGYLFKGNLLRPARVRVHKYEG